MASSFSAQVADWAHRVDGAVEAIFRESAQEVVSQAQAMVPVDTGFLKNSVVASLTSMPPINPAAKGTGVSYSYSGEQITATIAGAEISSTVFVGWTASYAYFVHAGANGRAPRPWVTLAAQRWSSIVEMKSAELRQRLGL